MTLYEQVISINNLRNAYIKARKNKTRKQYVIEFEKELEENIERLHYELLTRTYNPEPLKNFIIKDPKTRRISKSAFKDRVVHHAVCNIIEPLLDKRFIYDSYANRKGKGTLKALKRLDQFKQKATNNNTIKCYALKADIKHYFETVNHEKLLRVISKVVIDDELKELIKIILDNHQGKVIGCGMPLGNLTSQFFANVYLNELDQYVKHELRVKYYLRYVDDFIILHKSRKKLEEYKELINEFLNQELLLELHPDKLRIKRIDKGITFLGYRVFYHHKLISKRNLKKFKRKTEKIRESYNKGLIEREKVIEKINGWLAYASHANTHNYCKKLLSNFNQLFPARPFNITSVKLHENFNNKIESSKNKTIIDKTLYLYNKGLSINELAVKRGIKESTVLKHLTCLVEYYQLPLKSIVPSNKVKKILKCIRKPTDQITEIKSRLDDENIKHNEVILVLANLKGKNKAKSINYYINWYRHVNCYRKCRDKERVNECRKRLQKLLIYNHDKVFTKNEFLKFIYEKNDICRLPEKEKRRFIQLKPV